MTRFGIDFDYKAANQHIWLVCAALIIINVLIVLTLFVSMYDYYMDKYSVLNIVKFNCTGLHQVHLLTAPALTYVYLMRNLQKRYAVLNQLLR